MKTLQEIKDDYAKDFWGCIDWNDAINYEGYTIDSDDLDRISKLHSKEVSKQVLINASDHLDPDHFEDVHYYAKTRNAILNESNIPES